MSWKNSFSLLSPIVRYLMIAILAALSIMIIANTFMFWLSGKVKAKYAVSQVRLATCTEVNKQTNADYLKLIESHNNIRGLLATTNQKIIESRAGRQIEMEKSRQDLAAERKKNDDIYEKIPACMDWRNLPVCGPVFTGMRDRADSRNQDTDS